MKKIREYLSRPAVTAVLFLLAIALLAGSTVTGARAALSNFSENYEAQMIVPNKVNITLMENGNATTGGAIMADVLGSDSTMLPGKSYAESLAIRNDSGIALYTRATIYKYWTDASGSKLYDKDAGLIELTLASDGKWIAASEPSGSSSGERTVVYYREALAAGETTTPFLTAVGIDGDAARIVKGAPASAAATGSYTVEYVYDGCKVCIEVSIDAVQTHSAQEAIRSAWGNHVTVTGGSLQVG